MTWEDTLRLKIKELETIATWASIVNLGSVRDHCRQAVWDLVKEADRIKQEALCKEKGGSK